jgi:hypothetical protein
MENNTKKGLIAAGIIALLVWFSKKGKVAETPTEEPIGGGGGGGIGGGGFTPSGLIVNTTTTTTPTPTAKVTTPTNLSPSLKGALGAQNVGTNIQGAVAKINPATGLPFGVKGNVVLTNVNPKPLIKQTTLPAVQANTSAPKPVLNTGASGGFGAVSSNPYSTTYTIVTCNNGKKYNVADTDIKAAGGVTKWCIKNGHSVATNVATNNVPFDGEIIRPSYKVDFF